VAPRGLADAGRILANVTAELRWAYDLAGELLAESLPRRWAHTQGVAACGRRLAPLVQEEKAGILEAAAVLHDIGYSPSLVDTGFHPLDGARHLRKAHRVPERVVRLVANHSFALLEAEERGLRAQLAAEFPLPDDPLLLDALVYCDMTTTPDGGRTTSGERDAAPSQQHRRCGLTL
jgi:hypothetical protein